MGPGCYGDDVVYFEMRMKYYIFIKYYVIFTPGKVLLNNTDINVTVTILIKYAMKTGSS